MKIPGGSSDRYARPLEVLLRACARPVLLVPVEHVGQADLRAVVVAIIAAELIVVHDVVVPCLLEVQSCRATNTKLLLHRLRRLFG